jgi:PBP1b-binding outer membrane lipoprotein LpoB
MKKLRLLAMVFAASMFFASCAQDETMDELLQDTELEQVSTDGGDDPETTPPDPPSGS